MINIAHQAGESDLNFLSRILERHGIHYFFDHNQASKLIITDRLDFHPQDHHPNTMVYAMSSKNKVNTEYNGIYSFSCQQQKTPKKIICTSYAPWHSNLSLAREEIIDENGYGVLYFDYPEATSYQDLEYFSKIKSLEIQSQQKQSQQKHLHFYSKPVITTHLNNTQKKITIQTILS
ncbi:hypothetical protein BGC07_03935 [Piscirickettsia litoralis]|uniref:Uncharacterized protein n=2 Tax=Piscirickettsia litoralis TaxID=1891921 RepID=A0ABX3A051_9GAMM|nr:hypothetical protein BGC07_03935 [Piscirickettsia litoralis]